MASDELRGELEKALAAPEEDLLAIVGYYRSQAELQALPPAMNDLIEKGKVWLEANHLQFQQLLCVDPSIHDYAQKNDNVVDLGVAICDSLYAANLGGIPVFVITAWILKKGLNNLCHDIWT